MVTTERRPIDLAAARPVVRRARGYWRRAGVPLPVRRRRADELQDHLEEVLRRGGRVEDVTGPDLPAFAAEWAQADRRHPVLHAAMQVASMLLVLPAALALLGPLVGEAQVGFELELALRTGVIVLLLVAWQAVRWVRGRLTAQQAAIIGVTGVAVYVVALAVVAAQAPAGFVAVPAVVAWSMLGVGLAVQATHTLLNWAGRL